MRVRRHAPFSWEGFPNLRENPGDLIDPAAGNKRLNILFIGA
jgi:hypothetical protein